MSRLNLLSIKFKEYKNWKTTAMVAILYLRIILWWEGSEWLLMGSLLFGVRHFATLTLGEVNREQSVGGAHIKLYWRKTNLVTEIGYLFDCRLDWCCLTFQLYCDCVAAFTVRRTIYSSVVRMTMSWSYCLRRIDSRCVNARIFWAMELLETNNHKQTVKNSKKNQSYICDLSFRSTYRSLLKNCTSWNYHNYLCTKRVLYTKLNENKFTSNKCLHN